MAPAALARRSFVAPSGPAAARSNSNKMEEEKGGRATLPSLSPPFAVRPLLTFLLLLLSPSAVCGHGRIETKRKRGAFKEGFQGERILQWRQRGKWEEGKRRRVSLHVKTAISPPNVLYVREDPSYSSFPAIWLHLLCSHSLLSSSYVSTNSVCVARLRGETGRK